MTSKITCVRNRHASRPGRSSLSLGRNEQALGRGIGAARQTGDSVLKAEGKRLGRPKIDKETEDAIRKALRRKGRPGILKIAKELGVGTSTVQRIAAEMG